MKVKMILPALTEAKSPFFRPVKYSLFPPLGLATLAGYLDDTAEATLQDEHVETLDTEDAPELVVIQVYITSARRSYELADQYRRRGAYVVLGGLHVTSLPEEAAAHADTIFLGAARHFAYAAGWKKFEPLWDMVIRAKRVSHTLPILEAILKGFSRHPSDEQFGAAQVLAGSVYR